MKLNQTEGLAIVEKYDAVFNYLYSPILNLPHAHMEFRKSMLRLLLRIPGEIYLAIKLDQVSKVNAVDSSLAELRWHLRFAGKPRDEVKMRMLTPQQHEVAECLIAEVGSMVNKIQKRLKSK